MPWTRKSCVAVAGVSARALVVLEDVDERVADDRSLLLRILDARERVEKAARRVDGDELDAEVRVERALHLLALVQPQQARVDEHAGELIADRPMHERRGDRRVDAARQAADHARRRRRARGSSRPRSRRTRPASNSAPHGRRERGSSR